jgi:hypothetical protein
MAGLDEPLGMAVEGPRYIPTEAGLDETRASAGDQITVEPDRAVAADLLSEVEGRKGAEPPTVAALAEVVGHSTVDDVFGNASVVRVDPLHMAGTAQRLQAAHVEAPAARSCRG